MAQQGAHKYGLLQYMEEYLQANQMMSLLRPVAYFSLKLHF